MPSLESINNLKSKEKEICDLYISGESSNKIAKKLQLSTSSIKKILKKYKIVIRNSSISHKIYDCDESIFELIDSHEKAYWVGFLTADATITNGSLKLALATKDITHIEKFRTFMKSNHIIHIYKQLIGESSIVKNRDKNYYYGIISIHNAKIIKDLSQYSITTNKSFTTEFGKNIPGKFINSYMAGLVDADGFVTVSNNKITIGFLSHNKFATDFNHVIHDYLDLSDNKLLSHHTNDKLKIVRFSGKQVFDIGKFLYTNTPVCLERKMNKISNFFK
jgi:hypothetical protein